MDCEIKRVLGVETSSVPSFQISHTPGVGSPTRIDDLPEAFIWVLVFMIDRRI